MTLELHPWAPGPGAELPLAFRPTVNSALTSITEGLNVSGQYAGEEDACCRSKGAGADLGQAASCDFCDKVFTEGEEVVRARSQFAYWALCRDCFGRAGDQVVRRRGRRTLLNPKHPNGDADVGN